MPLDASRTLPLRQSIRNDVNGTGFLAIPTWGCSECQDCHLRHWSVKMYSQVRITAFSQKPEGTDFRPNRTFFSVDPALKNRTVLDCSEPELAESFVSIWAASLRDLDSTRCEAKIFTRIREQRYSLRVGVASTSWNQPGPIGRSPHRQVCHAQPS